MITLDNLTISFDKKKVIDGISFTLPQGKTLVMLGKNGSGKTVILKAIAGLNKEYSGSITIGTRQPEEKASPKSPDRIGLAYVFQKGGLFDSMNVFNNVAFGLRRIKLDEELIRTKVTGALERVGLKGNELKLPSELSGGMQKRVGLARAVCLEPDIILFDDPTAGLDPILSDSMADLLIEIRESLATTSIVTTHDLKVAQKIADYIALLYNGRIVYFGTGPEFFSKSDSFARQFIEGDIEGPIQAVQ